jgi:surface antigen
MMKNRAPTFAIRASWAIMIVSTTLLSGCATTSGSVRLDETGNRIADANGVDEADDTPQNSAYYIRALKGGLLVHVPGLKLSANDLNRGLEAEYRALETAPGGQTITWQGPDGASGEVVAAAPYQVGSQNCRQYTHTVTAAGAQPVAAKGAACRNANGSWTPLQ